VTVLALRLARILIAVALAGSQAHAGDLAGTPAFRIQLGFQFGDRGKLEMSVNGVPVAATPHAVRMTCPPPPGSCAGMMTIMSMAAAASVVFLRAIEKNQHRGRE
jgi:hypothetical protein